MPTGSESNSPSAIEVQRRIEVALENSGVDNASEVATTAAEAIQPLIESLKAYRETAAVAAEGFMAISKLVRTPPGGDLRMALLAVLQSVEPWNGEWVLLAQDGP